MDKIKSGYKSVSNIYDKYITSGNLFFRIAARIIWGFDDRDYAEGLLAAIPADFSGDMLDIPAGTGILTYKKYRELPGAKIRCMDYSNDMLEIARERFDGAGIKNILCQQGDVGNIPFADGAFDLVLSMNGFHAFPDKEQAFMEIKRVLKPGGIFTGCFYVRGMTKRTDWFVRNIFVKNGTFSPPFFTRDELEEKLNKEYGEVKVWNLGSIACFMCRK